MISLTVQNITEIKVTKTHKVLPKDSYARTMKITTDEVVMEIVLFADKAKNLVEVIK